MLYTPSINFCCTFGEISFSVQFKRSPVGDDRTVMKPRISGRISEAVTFTTDTSVHLRQKRDSPGKNSTPAELKRARGRHGRNLPGNKFPGMRRNWQNFHPQFSAVLFCAVKLPREPCGDVEPSPIAQHRGRPFCKCGSVMASPSNRCLAVHFFTDQRG